MARPELDLTVEACADALRERRGHITLAADKLGVKYETLRKRVDRSPTLQAIISEFQTRRVDNAELALDAAVLRGEPWAVALVLKTLGKGRGYVERQEVTGKDGGELVIRVEYADVDIDTTAPTFSAAARD